MTMTKHLSAIAICAVVAALLSAKEKEPKPPKPLSVDQKLVISQAYGKVAEKQRDLALFDAGYHVQRQRYVGEVNAATKELSDIAVKIRTELAPGSQCVINQAGEWAGAECEKTGAEKKGGGSDNGKEKGAEGEAQR